MPAPKLIISLHDVSPHTWTECQRLLQMLDEIGPLPSTLLVVPEYHRKGTLAQHPDFIKQVEKRLTGGDEVALHGYYHLDDELPLRNFRDWWQRRVYTAAEGEFSVLPEEMARQRIEAGLRQLQQFGWSVEGFVAPAWLMSPGTRAALSSLSLRYTSTLHHLYALPDWQCFHSQSLVYSSRSLWRRIISRHWNDILFQRQLKQSLIRLSLHPADARHPRLMAHWRQLLMAARQQGRQAITKNEWIKANACAKPAFS